MQPIPSDIFAPSRLERPYRIICGRRSVRVGHTYRQQLVNEIGTQELHMLRAIDGVRVHREFQDPIYKPTGKGEIRIRLTESESFKLNELLKDAVQ